MKSLEILDREFLTMRTHLLDIAATFDRITRGDDVPQAWDDPRMDQLRETLKLLASDAVQPPATRAEAVQMLFTK